MEASSAAQGSKPATASASASASASSLLAGLPSRGFMSTAAPSSNLGGGMRVYVCDHDTLPPEDQVIKTDQMNILIRSLTLKKSNKGEIKGGTSAEGSRKRVLGKTLDGRASSKRPMTEARRNAQRDASSSGTTDRDYQGLTVDRLRVLLREKGLSPKGRKDELIARLREAK